MDCCELRRGTARLCVLDVRAGFARLAGFGPFSSALAVDSIGKPLKLGDLYGVRALKRSTPATNMTECEDIMFVISGCKSPVGTRVTGQRPPKALVKGANTRVKIVKVAPAAQRQHVAPTPAIMKPGQQHVAVQHHAAVTSDGAGPSCPIVHKCVMSGMAAPPGSRSNSEGGASQSNGQGNSMHQHGNVGASGSQQLLPTRNNNAGATRKSLPAVDVAEQHGPAATPLPHVLLLVCTGTYGFATSLGSRVFSACHRGLPERLPNVLVQVEACGAPVDRRSQHSQMAVALPTSPNSCALERVLSAVARFNEVYEAGFLAQLDSVHVIIAWSTYWTVAEYEFLRDQLLVGSGWEVLLRFTDLPGNSTPVLPPASDWGVPRSLIATEVASIYQATIDGRV
jgi:hypothetical protein